MGHVRPWVIATANVSMRTARCRTLEPVMSLGVMARLAVLVMGQEGVMYSCKYVGCMCMHAYALYRELWTRWSVFGVSGCQLGRGRAAQVCL